MLSSYKKIDTLKTAYGDFHIILPTVPKVPSAIVVPQTPQTPLLPSIPSVTEVPQAIHLAGSDMNINRHIKFSKRIPPNYIPHSFDKELKRRRNKNTRIGEITKDYLSAYLRGKLLSLKEVKEKLTKAGFTIIASVPLDKKSTLISVVFTDNSLLKLSSKENRGFASTLRVLIDTKEKSISITNPLYVTKGFLQNDYNEKIASNLLTKILTQFSGLKNSKDALRAKLLAGFHFMKGMPYYKEMLEVASGDDLEKRIKNNKKVVFSHKLQNGSTIVGVTLGRRTQKFYKKIGRNNIGMLPYPVLIENGKAKILDPKYYIAYMYPLLTMSKFMIIATIPDAIFRDVERIFRKKRR